MLKRLFASRKHPFVPGIDKPEHIEFDLSGNKLSLTLPPHSDYEGFEADQAPITKVNIFDPSIYREPEKIFTSTLLVKRNWEFYGPIWKNRPVGTTRFLAVVERANCLPNEMSCFNPNHFEQVMNRFMYQLGPESAHISSNNLIPANWLISKTSNSTWIQFEKQKDLQKLKNAPAYSAAQYSSFLQTPLDDRHYLQLIFHNSGYAPTNYSIRQMNHLRDLVIKNTKLNLSQSAVEALNAAQSKWPNATISEHRKPINWKYPEMRRGDTSKGEPRFVILKPGAPAPEFTAN